MLVVYPFEMIDIIQRVPDWCPVPFGHRQFFPQAHLQIPRVKRLQNSVRESRQGHILQQVFTTVRPHGAEDTEGHYGTQKHIQVQKGMLRYIREWIQTDSQFSTSAPIAAATASRMN